MSRLGKLPVAIPSGVQVKVEGQKIEVKGSKGSAMRSIVPEIRAVIKEGAIHFSPAADGPNISALWGLSRVLVANMVTGVSQGYRKTLEIVGVGYKAELKGKDLSILAGYSSPRLFKAVPGITFGVENQTKITIDGFDKEKVGEIAAEIRKIRKPEPYKGKGIKYAGEHIRRKAGKVAGK
ncbi:MAG: 50S ribosomal protein L6 [Chitinispirillaceae bacterium]|nr:50S ribosomal protein L6 [Chitinispirillaceae bacterium]